MNEIAIDEEVEREVDCLSGFFHDREGALDSHACIQRPLVRSLNGRAVGDWVAEGQSEFDHVGSTSGCCEQQLETYLWRGVAQNEKWREVSVAMSEFGFQRFSTHDAPCLPRAK